MSFGEKFRIKSEDYRVILEELSNRGHLTSFDTGLAIWAPAGTKWFCKYSLKYNEITIQSVWFYAETIDAAIQLGAKDAKRRYNDISKLSES